MPQVKPPAIWIALMVATWTQSIMAYKFNATIYDNNLTRVTYSNAPACVRWEHGWLPWKTCNSWLKPWASSAHHSQNKEATFHSSLNHQLASMTIKFEGTDIWVYGPPASLLTELPPDYQICLHESYHPTPKTQCYQVNVAEAYSASKDKDKPVVVFARGQLQNHRHRLVISVANPMDDAQEFNGIRFSHAVYTNERPTPWPVEEDHWRYREVVMHDTHLGLSYTPPIEPELFWGTSPWSAKVHTEDGTSTSWHELKSNKEGSVETKIRAGAVALYGAPSAYIEIQDSLGSVCIRLDRGLCETVDLKTIYANQWKLAQHESEPVLLWRNDTLDPSRETRVSIHLVKESTGAATIFPFKSITYLEEQEYSSPRPPVGHLRNVTVNHDNQVMSFNPKRHCIRELRTDQCKDWSDPWVTKEIGPSGRVLTYRSTLSRYRTKEDPHIMMSFKGSAVYLYGAPNAYATRPFAPQHVCINNVCRVIDVEQAYLHPPGPAAQDIGASLYSPYPELEPVLIWSTTGLDDKVEHTLQLALAPLPSSSWGNDAMSIVKVVYTQVTYPNGKGRPNPPTPKPERAYSGPLEPPHATKQVPLEQKNKPLPGYSVFTLLAAALFAAYVFLVRHLDFRKYKPDGTKRLLSNNPPPNHTRQQPPETLGWPMPASPPSRKPNATDNTFTLGTRR